MNHLKFPFSNSNLIENNYSQAGQDLFVLGILNGKTNGNYLEIGAGPAISTSNSYLLESVYGWRGASVEFNLGWYNQHKEFNRKHHIELIDARTVNYEELLQRAGITETDIDYVSVDCEPPEVTFQALQRLPFDTHRFAVITFEHDSYACGDSIKIESRAFLQNKGYELVASNISPLPELGDFEDWYVHPALISREHINKFKAVDNTIKLWTKYLLEDV